MSFGLFGPAGEGYMQALDDFLLEGIPPIPQKLDEGIDGIFLAGIAEKIHRNPMGALDEVVKHGGGYFVRHQTFPFYR